MKMEMTVYAGTKNMSPQQYVDSPGSTNGYVNVVAFGASKMNAIIPAGTEASDILHQMFYYDGNGNFKIDEVSKSVLIFLRRLFDGHFEDVELVPMDKCLGSPINDGFLYNYDKEDADTVEFFCTCNGHCYDSDRDSHCEPQFK